MGATQYVFITILLIIIVYLLINDKKHVEEIKKKCEQENQEALGQVNSKLAQLEKEKVEMLRSHKTEIEKLKGEYEDEKRTMTILFCREKDGIIENYENKLYDLQVQSEQEKERLRKQSAAELKEVREQIENRKAVLTLKNEKELLVDTMIALDGYSNRIDRLESMLGHEQIEEKLNTFSTKIENQMDDISKSVDVKFSQVDLDGKIQELSQKILSRLERYDITNGINDIRDDLDTLQMGMNSIRCNVVNQNSKETLVSMVNGMKDSFVRLFYEINEAKSEAEEAKSAAEDAESAAYYAQNEAEEAKREAMEAKDTAENAEHTAQDAKYTADSIQNSSSF